MGRAKRNPSPRDAWLRAGRWVSLRSTHPTVLLHRAVSRGYAPDGFYQAMRNDVPASSVAASRSTASTRACGGPRSEEHTSELQSLMRISYAVFCLKKKKPTHIER